MKIETQSIDLLKKWPSANSGMVSAVFLKEIETSTLKIVVLDDDPTGVQTVHSISVYTDWSPESMRSGFLESNRLFYVLTNSRSFTAEQTAKAHEEIAGVIDKVATELSIPYLLISRSDSTLRGHYPLETQILKETIESKGHIRFHGEILCPFFPEGGRYTIDDIHYVKYDDKLVPVGETEFAKDKTFGYSASDIKYYIEEKTNGAYPGSSAISITLDELRALDLESIESKLMGVENFNKIIVNAIDYDDLRVFCTALYRVSRRGKHFIFRSAAGLVKIIGNISDKPLLTRPDMIVNPTDAGGIVMIGSHTQKTTQQLESLLTLDHLESIEFNSDLVLNLSEFEKEIDRVLRKTEAIIKSGETAVIYTRRKLLSLENDTKDEALKRSVCISNAVQSLVANLSVTPSFIVAKGGITSSDIGTKALRVKRALVMGQIQPGIPVWQIGEESKFPSTPYVIFPGNVGEEDTLKNAVAVLIKKSPFQIF